MRPRQSRSEIVFLFDVDNTLLDNDRIIADLRRLSHPRGRFRTRRTSISAIFEQLRDELGYADYLGALQRYRVAYPRDPCLLAVSSYPGELSLCQPALSRLARRAGAVRLRSARL